MAVLVRHRWGCSSCSVSSNNVEGGSDNNANSSDGNYGNSDGNDDDGDNGDDSSDNGSKRYEFLACENRESKSFLLSFLRNNENDF